MLLINIFLPFQSLATSAKDLGGDNGLRQLRQLGSGYDSAKNRRL